MFSFWAMSREDFMIARSLHQMLDHKRIWAGGRMNSNLAGFIYLLGTVDFPSTYAGRGWSRNEVTFLSPLPPIQI